MIYEKSAVLNSLKLAGRERCYGVMVLWVGTGEQWQQNSHMIQQLILKKQHLIQASMLLMPFSTDYFAVHYPFTFHVSHEIF